MKHPPYHLRQNKAVDRLLFIDSLRKLANSVDISQYTYYGLGGPYLEDFRLIYEFFPDIKMVSIEKDAETYKRQHFHLPCGTIQLLNVDSKSFAAQYDSKGNPSIFWLDYQDLSLGDFEEFQVVLEEVADFSIVKITMRANSSDHNDLDGTKRIKFREKFKKYWPSFTEHVPRESVAYAYLIQEMAHIAAQLALPAAIGRVFQPITSFYYEDGPAGMFTLTGVVCAEQDREKAQKIFCEVPFANFSWGKPTHISVPMLSTRERLHLQEHLPCKDHAGERLSKLLGYSIDKREDTSILMLEQYAVLHRYFPYFMKAIP